MSCNNQLRWFELIPIFSFLIQSGKCRRCASKISHQYPLVEIITGFVFALIAFKFMPILYSSYNDYMLQVILFTLIFSFLIVISFYDLKHKIIPDKLSYSFIILSFFSIFINYSPVGHTFILPSVSNLIAGPVIALPFVLIWLFSKGRLMGLGDGKLLLGIGWMLGLSSGIFAVVIAFWVGTIVSLLLVILSKRKINMKTEIPFAPFLIVSAFVTFLFNFDLFSLIRFFSF